MKPASRSAVSFAGETDSGLASVVTSAPSANPKRSSIRRRIRISSAADSSDGVPPPKNTVSTRGTAAPSTRAARSISATTASTYPPACSAPRSPGTYVLKSQ